ncbi:hypothetical protein [Tindallia californiensis]|uniref:Uncharacterized protein n=1 Tax=Tindallia californiensis TaxID=159292 RepID=A0A1H3NQA4_9FIRM|nr:hypothetical protein [Tindallia californiensis]SDY90860.1 hypothetical protein SAMN05192546_105224 [Tindallia californiensis]
MLQDLTGFHLDYAISILDTFGIEVILKETNFSKFSRNGLKRIVRQRYTANNVLELTVAYF